MAENSEISDLARALGENLVKLGWRAATAESCTGGAVAVALVAVPGASSWFDGAMVSYADHVKRDWLGVQAQDLTQFGAVSEQVVRQMACGVLSRMDVNLSVAVSGVAGPMGGSDDKPVGTVWIAWAQADGQQPLEIQARCMHFCGDRADIQRQAVLEALRGMLILAKAHGALKRA